MKLKTVVSRMDRFIHFVSAIDGDMAECMEYDSACANALMQAMEEFQALEFDSYDYRDVLQSINLRADVLMKEWGFEA